VRCSHAFGGQSYRSGSGDETFYSGSYEFQKSDRRFRAPLLTPRPTVYGPHTAKVVGERNEGEEGDIDVDEFGRIFLRFHWDREDGSTSCRTRVAQMWSGKNWGGQVIPRIGQEVVVEFLEGNPDLPLVTGTVVNDQHKPPYSLPDNKTQSGLKSESTDGAGFADCYNEIKFEDRKGQEVFSMQAEKDHEVLVKNKETREIGPDYGEGGYSRETTLKNGNDKLHVQNGKLDVEALTEVNLKVGESTIKMLPASIEISSPTITIKSVAKTEVLSDAMVIVNGALVKIN
jgi:type VI secretion system secreted protein VgrG